MSGDMHFGDRVSQYGDNNTGIVHNYGPADPAVARARMIEAVQDLRTHLSDADRQVIDQCLPELEAADGSDPTRLRNVLAAVSGIAVLVGDVGAPVVEAVRNFLNALGA
ncbi:hypothetical protein ACFFKE_22005 [Streptomyces mutabilis]|uniref:hypothetical protein n=1 Tax=Streptomyces mutabilis TaxID=67332 RepID=UPI00177D617B|nr:hypothetical protein [Streptomyces mutabilis]GGQ07817.1 hypothetical protein GCM10010279_14140 [Streptomyces mutabilis]